MPPRFEIMMMPELNAASSTNAGVERVSPSIINAVTAVMWTIRSPPLASGMATSPFQG